MFTTPDLSTRIADFPELPEDDYHWTVQRRALREHLARDPIEQFLTWPPVTFTMFVGEHPRVRKDEWEALIQSNHGRWEAAIPAELGNQPNTHLIHQAYHLWNWERETGLKVESLSRIVEIGGGYGALARICRRLGFAGEYVIYDIPETAVLQDFYRRQFGFEITQRLEVDLPDSGDLVIGLWSLSEMLPPVQSAYLAGVTAQHCLIGFSEGVKANFWYPLVEHFSDATRVVIPHFGEGRYLIK
jgi:hypothetical protein